MVFYKYYIYITQKKEIINLSELAINGGSKVREKLFPAHKTIGSEEIDSVIKVMESGTLSKYLGAWHNDFYGGNMVQALEKAWAEYFNVKHAISVNSNTSGLYCTMGAIGIEPGDEVIVCGYSMSISAVAPLLYGGIPVFADIEPDCFCLSPESIESKITINTKAIIIVNLFGQVYDAERINAIAIKHNLKVIEDNAQAPGGLYKKKFAGTLGTIGVFSLNYHKHIHCGEGGIIVTNNDELADKLKMIRNHAEAVVGPRNYKSISNMLGFNFRLTEIEATIALNQLLKLDKLIDKRLENVKFIEDKLSFIPALTPPRVRKNTKHVYYVHGYRWNSDLADGLHRNKFIDAVKAELPAFKNRETEGVKLSYGYVKPNYKLPIFINDTKRSNFTRQLPDYSKTYCKVIEKLHFDELVHHEFMVPSMEKCDINDVINAFEKVWVNKDKLFT